MKKCIITLLFLTLSMVALAAEKKANDLVDVTKESSLAEYLKKMNVTVGERDLESQDLNVDKEPLLDESNIPLTEIKSKKEVSNGLSPVNKMMISVFGLILIAAGFFAGLKKWGSRVGHKAIASHIKILTQKSIGPKKQLMMIRVAGETILLGVTDSNITPIKTLSLMEDELPDFTEPHFSGHLKNKIEETKITEEAEEVDGFSVSRLDDVKSAVNKRYMNS